MLNIQKRSYNQRSYPLPVEIAPYITPASQHSQSSCVRQSFVTSHLPALHVGSVRVLSCDLKVDNRDNNKYINDYD